MNVSQMDSNGKAKAISSLMEICGQFASVVNEKNILQLTASGLRTGGGIRCDVTMFSNLTTTCQSNLMYVYFIPVRLLATQ